LNGQALEQHTIDQQATTQKKKVYQWDLAFIGNLQVSNLMCASEDNPISRHI
jgi:hypothetical protein